MSRYKIQGWNCAKQFWSSKEEKIVFLEQVGSSRNYILEQVENIELYIGWMPPGFWKYKENVACECRYHCRVHLQWTLRWYLQSHGPNWSITDAQLSVCLGYRRNTEQACLVAERTVWVLESRQSVAMYENFFLPQTSWPLASLGTSKEITCLLYIAKQYGIDFEPL